ncbi:hypothetical protein JCM3765_004056 [Sporobolomyces pararoseus]
METQPHTGRSKRLAAINGEALRRKGIADQLATTPQGSQAKTSTKRSHTASASTKQAKQKRVGTGDSHRKKLNVAQSPSTLESAPSVAERWNAGLGWGYAIITASYVPPPPPRRTKQNKGH